MNTLSAKYTERYNLVLKPLAEALNEFLEGVFSKTECVCRLSTRAKAIDSFLEKAERTQDGKHKYNDPLNQIQDQLGALIVTRLLSEVPTVSDVVDKYFSRIERQTIEPDSESEFGYVGEHYILFIPNDILSVVPSEHDVDFFELQIKTLFQYAWSETNHLIGYKRIARLTSDQRRRSAFVAAQAWGADRAVDELYEEVNAGTQSEATDA